MKFPVALAALVLTAVPSASFAQEQASAETVGEIIPQVKSRDLTGTFGGKRVSYTATVKENVLFSEDETKAEAVIVTTSYVANPRDTSRPVFFLFNGGPGSGSVWLQMGAFGPKRVAIPGDARDDGRRYRPP